MKPKWVEKYFGFMVYLLGRGLFHIFLAMVCVPNVPLKDIFSGNLA